jgi:acyl-CoA dehydrogenase
MLSGRFADAFGTLYLGYACLWYYEKNRNVEGIDKVLELAMDSLLHQNQEALRGISSNFTLPVIGSIMSLFAFPLGLPYKGPSDKARQAASKLITTPSGIRNLLSEGMFRNNQVLFCHAYGTNFRYRNIHFN